MNANTLEWVAIGLLGLVSASTRIAGVPLARWIPRTLFWRRFMNYLPSTLLAAVAVPSFVTGDFAITAAAVLTLLAAACRLNLVISMSVGVATVALLRAMGQ
ncbi:MAG TPA: AzlD domain-containing protein [Steroidobacteraceae bacterium]|nr:AzlD domain-containing protein [Steroidobacteraceae bacterium]